MEFQQFLEEVISLANLPFTVMMGLVVVYWSLVIFGALGAEAIDFDMDLDVDADLDLDVDGIETGSSGFFGGVLSFMNLGQVPFMIVFSLVVFFMWICSVLSNHYLVQGENLLLSVVFLLPNLAISMLLTKALIWPFLLIPQEDETLVVTRKNMIGKIGVVKTSEITEQFGQVEIQIDGPPVVINARTVNGDRLLKGDCAKIAAYNPANDTFSVSLSKWEKF